MGLLRHYNLSDYALGNVLKHGTRSIAIIILIMMPATMLYSIEFIRAGVEHDVSLSLSEGPDIIVQRTVAGRQMLVPHSWVSTVREVSGVRHATGRVWGYIEIGTGGLFTVIGVNVTEYASIGGTIGTEIVGDGRFLQTNSTTREMVIGQGIIDLMSSAVTPVQVGVGSIIHLIAYDDSLLEFRIVGVFRSTSKILSYDTILTDISSARELFGVDNDSYTDIAVWTHWAFDTNSVALAIETTIVGARVLTNAGIQTACLKTYGTRAGIVAIIWAFLMLSSVLLVLFVASVTSEETRREVGILKALGFSTPDVLEIRLIESLTLALVGASMGLSAAIIFDYVLCAPFIANYLLGWSMPLLNGGIPLSIEPWTIIMVYAVATVSILVATVIPAWRNSMLEPEEVLRGL